MVAASEAEAAEAAVAAMEAAVTTEVVAATAEAAATAEVVATAAVATVAVLARTMQGAAAMPAVDPRARRLAAERVLALEGLERLRPEVPPREVIKAAPATRR